MLLNVVKYFFFGDLFTECIKIIITLTMAGMSLMDYVTSLSGSACRREE